MDNDSVKFIGSLLNQGPVFGASRIECGNYLDLDLEKCKAECKLYRDVLRSEQSFKYAD